MNKHSLIGMKFTSTNGQTVEVVYQEPPPGYGAILRRSGMWFVRREDGKQWHMLERDIFRRLNAGRPKC